MLEALQGGIHVYATPSQPPINRPPIHPPTKEPMNHAVQLQPGKCDEGYSCRDCTCPTDTHTCVGPAPGVCKVSGPTL